MVKLGFQNKTLEKIFRNYKWSRNNSIQFLEHGIQEGILGYKPENNNFGFQPISYQFRCLVSTTDAYYRQLSGSNNQDFGVLVGNDHKVIPKAEILEAELLKLMKDQLVSLENLLKTFDEKKLEDNVKIIQALSNHEYLHQGQLLLLFRQANVDVPDRFRKAFAL